MSSRIPSGLLRSIERRQPASTVSIIGDRLHPWKASDHTQIGYRLAGQARWKHIRWIIFRYEWLNINKVLVNILLPIIPHTLAITIYYLFVHFVSTCLLPNSPPTSVSPAIYSDSNKGQGLFVYKPFYYAVLSINFVLQKLLIWAPAEKLRQALPGHTTNMELSPICLITLCYSHQYNFP